MTDSQLEYRDLAEREDALRWAASESDRNLHRRRLEAQRPDEREER